MIISCPNCTARFNLNAELLGETGRKVKCAKCAHRWFAKPPAGSTAAAAAPPKPVEAPPPPPEPPPTPAEPPPPAAPPAPDEPPPPAEEPRAVAPEPEDQPEDRIEEDRQTAQTPSPPPLPSAEDLARFQARLPPTKSTIILWIVLFVFIVGLVTGTIYFRRHIAALYPQSNGLFLAIGLPTDTLGYGLKIHDPKMSQRTEGNDRILVIKGEIENETGSVIDIPLLRGAVKNARGQEMFVWSFKTKEPRVLAGEKNAYETEIRNPPPGATHLNITFNRESEMMAERKRAKEAAAEPKK